MAMTNPRPDSAASVGRRLAPRLGVANPGIANYLELTGCPYEPGMLIGEGGMAQVYLGTHRQSGRLAAIKVPKGGEWARERFRQEIEAMDRLEHPHVMPLLEADPQRRWFAMPWAEYSLRELHRRDPFDWPALRKALSSIAGAMMHAHSNGCIHRDASPDNLLRLRNAHWALSDFGIAKLEGDQSFGTETGEHFGTRDFSAPEVHADPASATAAADCWSIGALASWFTSIRQGQTSASEQESAWLALIEGTMCHEPAERWTLPRIAAHLDSLPAMRPLIAVATSPAEICARCGVGAGLDGSQRCRGCGFIEEY